jgi:hypothetical protein
MKILLLGLIAVTLIASLVTVSANPPDNKGKNLNWAHRAGNTPGGGSVGHINPAHPNQNLGDIYPGPDDCGFRNGEAKKGSQHVLPDAVPFEQALPPE